MTTSNTCGRNKEEKCHQHNSYGGLRWASPEIARLVPKTEVYVEPFAGHAYTYQNVRKSGKIKRAVLGDKNCEATRWQKERFKKHENLITKCQDWKKTVAQEDSKKTTFFFDPPWDKCFSQYKGNCDLAAPKIIERSKTMKGNVVIALRDTPGSRKMLCKKPFKCKSIRSQIGGFNAFYDTLVGVKK
jgi:hypothetical protein